MQIEEIVAQENEARRERATRRAREIVSSILATKADIARHEERLKTLRKELQELNVTEVTPADILG